MVEFPWGHLMMRVEWGVGGKGGTGGLWGAARVHSANTDLKSHQVAVAQFLPQHCYPRVGKRLGFSRTGVLKAGGINSFLSELC